MQDSLVSDFVFVFILTTEHTEETKGRCNVKCTITVFDGMLSCLSLSL